MCEHADQHGMLVHIGEIARMEGVAVVHRRDRARSVNGAATFGEPIAIDKVLAARLAIRSNLGTSLRGFDEPGEAVPPSGW
jgi:hypothetical protein